MMIIKYVRLTVNVLTCYCLKTKGLADLEEGELNGQELKLSTANLGRMSFGVPPAVKEVILYLFLFLPLSFILALCCRQVLCNQFNSFQYEFKLTLVVIQQVHATRVITESAIQHVILPRHQVTRPNRS